MAHVNQALANEALKKLMNAIAARDGIKVVFDRECAQAHASMAKVITLQPPGAIDADEYWFTAMHELGHLLKEMDWSYTHLFKMLNMKDRLVMAVANIVMDNLDERNFFGRYEGIDRILSEGRAMWCKKDWMKKTVADVKLLEKEVPHVVILGLMMEDMLERQGWQGHAVEALPIVDYEDCFVDFRNGLRAIGFKRRIASILGAPRPEVECRDLVLDILALVGYDPPPPEPEEGKGKGDGEGKPEPCEACGGTGEDPSTGTECEVCKGTGVKPGEEKGVSGDTEEKQEVRKMDLSEADPDHNPSGIGLGHEGEVPDLEMTSDDLSGLESILKSINKSLLEKLDSEPKRKKLEYGWRNRGDEYIPWHKNNVKDLEKDIMKFRPHQRNMIVQALGSSTVSKQISKYLKALVTESYTYGTKRGRIHQKNMHRIISQKPQPGIAPSIFKKKNNSILKTDSAVTLLLDCSGSMSGSKYSIGAACCVALSECLTAIQVPHEILGFTENSTLESYIFKNFGTTFTKDKLLTIMANEGVRLGNNADGESVLWGAERLMMRKESRKLMIVLSDGSPAGYFSGDGNAYLKYVCNMLETESPIDLVGIGINTTAVRRFYKNNVVVDNPSMLDETLFGVLKTYLV